MPWAVEGSAAERKTQQIAAALRRYVTTMLDGQAEEPASDQNASGGFIDSCEEYAAVAFVCAIAGRDYYVTVEDVTPAE